MHAMDISLLRIRADACALKIAADGMASRAALMQDCRESNLRHAPGALDSRCAGRLR